MKETMAISDVIKKSLHLTELMAAIALFKQNDALLERMNNCKCHLKNIHYFSVFSLKKKKRSSSTTVSS